MTNKQRVHWRVKHAAAKKWKLASGFECQHQILESHLTSLPFNRAVLTLTRHSTKEPDFDGLVSGFKHVIDGIVVSGLIKDDSRRIIGQPSYLWEKAKRGDGHVTVRIELIRT